MGRRSKVQTSAILQVGIFTFPRGHDHNGHGSLSFYKCMCLRKTFEAIFKNSSFMKKIVTCEVILLAPLVPPSIYLFSLLHRKKYWYLLLTNQQFTYTMGTESPCYCKLGQHNFSHPPQFSQTLDWCIIIIIIIIILGR